MIKKIEINNVGRFRSAITDGDEQYFKKNTFIYGKNTFGKSTLTAIFRSLRDGRSDFIVGRKTIGSQKQLVKIIPERKQPVEEYRYSTDEARWNSEYKDIIIFDNHFVRESVYTQNQQIGQEQQKNIETFMLGAKGVDYNKKISELNEKINKNKTTQTSINTEYSGNKHLMGGFTFEDFIGLEEVADVDQKIDETQKNIDKIKNSELISSKLKSAKALIEKYKDFDVSKLSEKLTINSELITEHFNNHVNENETKQTYGDFLQTGSMLRTRKGNECCPFCTQEIKSETAKEFLQTIDLIYNEKYRKLQQAIKEAENLFLPEVFLVEFDKIKTDLQQAGYSLKMDLSDFIKLLENGKKFIINKKEDLSSEINKEVFFDISLKANSFVAEIDSELVNFEKPVEKKFELETTMKEFLASKERHGLWREKCENYIRAKKDNESLSAQKTAIWDEYLIYANGLSATMLTEINMVLSACNCNFNVQQFNFRGNQRQDLFALSMEGIPISNDGNDEEKTVKNCLSDSDKWVLALAFFLATVKNDSTIKVVVMDDPVSSFDSDRKRIILREIKRIIADTDKQLILLTHEKGFFQLLHAEDAGGESVFLRIALNAQKGSDLIVCCPDEDLEFMSDYNGWIFEMRSALNSQELKDVKNAHSKIRPVIEHILKAKYPLSILKEHKTIEKMLLKLEEAGGHYEKNSRRKEIETLLTNIAHHDNSGVGQYPSSEIGINDYKKDIKDSFNVIAIL